MKPASFDSASAMVRATARYLKREDFPNVGMPRALGPLASLVNAVPEGAREAIYALSGGLEAVRPSRLGSLDAEELAGWVVDQYPRRRYPAAAIGASNGAAVHLAAALGIPWLPQTLLLPVLRPAGHIDDMKADMEWGREPGRRLLSANPDLQLHHMHDPNQDRRMLEYMTYFRLKRLRLGRTYERFLREHLAPGGTIYLLDCRRRWPVKVLGDRHYFQPGAMGGLEPEEYLRGSERVRRLLERHDSPFDRWNAPEPDAEAPEAEWGFEPALAGDVEGFADERGFRVRRLAFEEPEDLSPLVADLHRWWYRRRGMLADRLLAESFIVMEPYWALVTGSVPFWMKFNTEVSAAALERYLDAADPYDEVHVTLFSHGTESAGVASVERWRELTARARDGGRLLGVDEARYPKDFGVFGRYSSEIRELPARYPLPGWLAESALEEFLAGEGRSYDVTWNGDGALS